MLYHFEFELSDVDRGVYERLDFRIVQHPSETAAFLLTRSLAFALSYQAGLEFSPGDLAEPELPAIQAKSAMGTSDLWIEIGNPSARKLHKASKAARLVVVYTYKNASLLAKEIIANAVHRAEEIQIFAFDPKFLQQLEEQLKKKNRWTILHHNGQLDINTGGRDYTSQVQRVKI